MLGIKQKNFQLEGSLIIDEDHYSLNSYNLKSGGACCPPERKVSLA
ncbi:hypothetical protein [Bacillus sp. SM2101]|nr:hypothetical protein [Bacillus sp. SM2101]